MCSKTLASTKARLRKPKKGKKQDAACEDITRSSSQDTENHRNHSARRKTTIMATMLKASVQKLNPQTTCVLVCDVQQRFTEIIFGFQELVKCSSYLVKVANALDLPVVCTEQYPKAFKQTVPELSTLIQQKEKNKTFEKTMFSMATPEVMSHLSSMGIESCVLCGLETHVCVLQTTLDLLDNGLHVHIACDAVSSQRPFDRSVALKRLAGAGAVLSTSEAVVFQLLKDSKHPHFKSVAPFVRENAEDAKSSPLQSLA